MLATERSSLQQLNASFMYDRSLLQQLSTNVRSRLDDNWPSYAYYASSKARVASLYCYHDDVTPCIAISPSMHESNATLNPRFLKKYKDLEPLWETWSRGHRPPSPHQISAFYPKRSLCYSGSKS
jgi:hypothetical protein